MYIFKETIYPSKYVYSDDFTINLESMFLCTSIFLEDKINVYIVLDGDFKLIYNEKRYKLSKHDILILDRKSYSILHTLNKKNLLMRIQLDSSFLGQNGLSLKDSIIYNLVEDSDLLSNIFTLLFLYRKGLIDKLMSDHKTRNFFIATIDLLSRQRKEKSFFESSFNEDSLWSKDLVYDIAADILENPSVNFSLDFFSRKYNLSSSLISRNFKDIIGFKFSIFLKLQRLCMSLDKLLFTDKSILDIALESGFNNSKTFHEAFKTYLNSTPFQFRKKIKASYTSDATYNSIESVKNSKLIKEILSMDFKTESLIEKNNLIEYIISENNSLVFNDRNDVKRIIYPVGQTIDYSLNDFQTCFESIPLEYLRVEIKIEVGGKILLRKNNHWSELTLTEMALYISVTERLDKKTIVSININSQAVGSLDKFMDYLNVFLNLLREVMGTKKFNKWIFELDMFDTMGISSKSLDEELDSFKYIVETTINNFDQINLGINIGSIKNVYKTKLKELLLNDILIHKQVQLISYKIADINEEKYIKNDVLDLHRLLMASYHLIEEFRKLYPDKVYYISLIELKGKIRKIPLKYYENIRRNMLKTVLYWILKTGIKVVEIDYMFGLNDGSLDNFISLGTFDQIDINKESMNKVILDYYLKKNYANKNLIKYYNNYVAKMLKKVICYSDKALVTTGGNDYHCLFSLDFDSSCQLLELNKDTCMVDIKSEIKIEFPVNKGEYKLRTYTIDSEHGNVISSIYKIGSIGNIGSDELSYLNEESHPLLEIESLTLSDKFSKVFKLEPFETKYFELIKTK